MCIFNFGNFIWLDRWIYSKWQDLDVFRRILAGVIAVSSIASEFSSRKLKEWLKSVAMITEYIEPCSPWQNGYCISINGKIRERFLYQEDFDNMVEAVGLTRK